MGSGRGHGALRKHRVSLPGQLYFITVCARPAGDGLSERPVADAIFSEAQRMEVDEAWRVRCATIMPDHLHALIELQWRLPLGRCVARLKARTAAALQTRGLSWQRSFFDHCLRKEEAILPIFTYIYLNPYRSSVVAQGVRWPWFWCAENDWRCFAPLLQNDLPPPEWIRNP
jgi:putative transposase